MLRIVSLWFCWVIVILFSVNVYGPSLDDSSRPLAHLSASVKRELPATLSNLLLALQRQSTDVDRYFSYANAVLGRPYGAEYIRPPGEAAEIVPDAAKGVVTPTRPLRPWQDFRVEYPPGIFIPILIPALFTKDSNEYFVLFCSEMAIVLTIAVILSIKTANALNPGSESKALARSILLVAALGCITVRRYDACIALAIAATIYGVAARRPMLAGISLALGVALKLVPALLGPPVLFWYATRRDWVSLRWAVASCAFCLGLIVAIYLLIAGSHAFNFVYYHAARPLQVESTLSGVLMLLKGYLPDIMTEVKSYGSDNVASPAEPLLRHITSMLEFFVLVGVYATAYFRMKNATNDRAKFIVLISTIGACLVAFMTLGKVFSVQYLTWLIPIGAISTATLGGRSGWRHIVANALTQVEFPYLYFLSVSINLSDWLASLFGLVILTRTFVLWRWITQLYSEPVSVLPEIAKGNNLAFTLHPPSS